MQGGFPNGNPRRRPWVSQPFCGTGACVTFVGRSFLTQEAQTKQYASGQDSLPVGKEPFFPEVSAWAFSDGNATARVGYFHQNHHGFPTHSRASRYRILPSARFTEPLLVCVESLSLLNGKYRMRIKTEYSARTAYPQSRRAARHDGPPIPVARIRLLTANAGRTRAFTNTGALAYKQSQAGFDELKECKEAEAT